MRPAELTPKAPFWLALVCLGYALAQVLGHPFARFLGWDEAVYLSEVSAFADPVGMAAHKARGITLLVAPIAQVTDSAPVIRAYMIGASTVGLYLAFLPWCQVIGVAAPAAAAILGSQWLALFYGSEVVPNLISALLAVGVVGLAFVYAAIPSIWRWSLVAVLVAASVTTRPVDGAFVALLVCSTGLLANSGKQRWALPAAAATGAVLGAVSWVIEAFRRFGGLIARMQGAQDLVGGGPTNNAVEYMRLLDGPLMWPDGTAAVSRGAIAMLLILVMLAIAGGVAVRSGDQPVLTVVWAGAILLAVPYLFWFEAAAPRFLIPAIAFLAISAAYGLTSLFGNSDLARRFVSYVAIVGLIGLAFWNSDVLVRISEEQVEARESAFVLGEELASRVAGHSCFFLSEYGAPQISFVSGCRGARYVGEWVDNETVMHSMAESGDALFVLLHSDQAASQVGASWQCESLPELPDEQWKVCAQSAQGPSVP